MDALLFWSLGNMQQFSELQSTALVSLILVGLGLVLYEAFEHRRIIKAAVKTAEAVSDIVETTVTDVVEGIETDVIVVDEIVQGKSLSEVSFDYIELESGGPNAGQWLLLFGGSIYNSGFGSFHYRMLSENSEVLASKLGSPESYLHSLDPPSLSLYQARGLTGDIRLSPFWIRQNLESLSIAPFLHGWVGSSASSLKKSIWTDWDRLREWIENWNTLSPSLKSKVNSMIESDQLLLTEMERLGEGHEVFIVRDRVLVVKELFARKGSQY